MYNSELPLPLNAEEDTDFYNYLSTIGLTSSWLDGTDEDEEGIWVDSYGNNITYFNWRSDQPDNNNGNEHYLHYRPGWGGKWNDHLGTKVEHIVCQRLPLYTTTQQPSTTTTDETTTDVVTTGPTTTDATTTDETTTDFVTTDATTTDPPTTYVTTTDSKTTTTTGKFETNLISTPYNVIHIVFTSRLFIFDSFILIIIVDMYFQFIQSKCLTR